MQKAAAHYACSPARMLDPALGPVKLPENLPENLLFEMIRDADGDLAAAEEEGCLDERGGVSKNADALVTSSAQEAAYVPVRMVVVHHEGNSATAHSAAAILQEHEKVELIGLEVVATATVSTPSLVEALPE